MFRNQLGLGTGFLSTKDLLTFILWYNYDQPSTSHLGKSSLIFQLLNTSGALGLTGFKRAFILKAILPICMGGQMSRSINALSLKYESNSIKIRIKNIRYKFYE